MITQHSILFNNKQLNSVHTGNDRQVANSKQPTIQFITQHVRYNTIIKSVEI